MFKYLEFKTERKIQFWFGLVKLSVLAHNMSYFMTLRTTQTYYVLVETNDWFNTIDESDLRGWKGMGE